MTPKEKAKELFQRHYQILIDADSDISAEIMISLLSIKAALLTVNEIFYDLQVTGSNKQIKFWAEVETELKEM